MNISHLNIVLKFYLNQLAVYWVVSLTDLKVSGMLDLVHLIKYMRQVRVMSVCNYAAEIWGFKDFQCSKKYSKPSYAILLSTQICTNCRCNRLRCPLARLSGLQCHNVHGINLYGVIVMTLMVNLHAGEQSRPV